MSASAQPAADAAKQPRTARSRSHPADAPPESHAHAPHARVIRHRAEVAHAVHGRVRLKIPGAKSRPDLLAEVKASFATLPGIDAIEVKPESGSLVIYYDTEHHPEIGSLVRSLSRAEAVPVAVIHPAAEGPPAPHHHPSTKVDDLTQTIEDEAEFLAEHSAVARSVVDAVKDLDRRLKRATHNNIDLKIMVPIALAGVTFLEVGAAAATPMWVTQVIFSMNHFVELHAHVGERR